MVSSPSLWHAPSPSSSIDATVRLPGSKSLTNRYLVLAALAEGTSRLRLPLRSRDTELMASALRSLGADITDAGADWIIEPGPIRGDVTVACGLAGTVMRFLPPVAALAQGPVRFDGDIEAYRRPMATGIATLRALGIQVDDDARGTLPFTVHGAGTVPGGTVRMDASASSQFVSGLLLAGARFEHGLTVVHTGETMPSGPHIVMTVEALRDAGVAIDDSEADTWRVEPGPLHPLDVVVEPDLSNAAAFLAAAMVTGGRVHVPDWPHHTTQAGDAIRDIFDVMGGDVTLTREGLTVTGPDRPGGLDIDLHDVGELTPVVAAVAALADSPSWLRGVAHLRGHETDRLSALAHEIEAVGGSVDVLDDGLHIRPGARRPATLSTYADHRMAMAAAVLGLGIPGTVVEDIETTSKTLPDFAGMWEQMVDGGATDSGTADGSADGDGAAHGDSSFHR